MGIVNITPDSFYNGSRNMDISGKVLVDKTLERVEKMLKEGAGYIDIGACSTRPGAECVDAAGEWKRILFVPTGALLSKASFNEGDSVPGIAHGVVIEHIPL